ncbi:MAG: hypothetical protein KF797_08925, partial [Flavobacteriales bacterium]|nr:hypothetical protein [Flavobacteriales bacterium]
MRAMLTWLPFVLAAWPYRPVKAQVQLVVEPRTFHTAEGRPLVEVNMAFLSGSFRAPANDRGFPQARIEALTLVEQNGAIVAFRKSMVQGQEEPDTLLRDVIHQEAFDLAPGLYDLTIEARDASGTDTTTTRTHMPLAVGSLPPGISISDILFAERIVPATEGEFSKYGYMAVPLLTDYLPRSITKLNFYAEVHGTERTLGRD